MFRFFKVFVISTLLFTCNGDVRSSQRPTQWSNTTGTGTSESNNGVDRSLGNVNNQNQFPITYNGATTAATPPSIAHSPGTRDNAQQHPHSNWHYVWVQAFLSLFIRGLSDIDDTGETLTLDIDLQIQWHDLGRDSVNKSNFINIGGGHYIVDAKYIKNIWIPDVNFDNNVQLTKQSLIEKPLDFKYFTGGGYQQNNLYFYTTRESVKLKCGMDFTYYPVDTQKCNFTMKTYSYNVQNTIIWTGNRGVYFQDPSDPNFDLQVDSIKDSCHTNNGQRLCGGPANPTFVILARRKVSYHMVQTYLPSILYILITCLCFLVPSELVEVRIGISMTTLLALTSMFSSVRESTPSVSYVKAIDIWMVICIFFVFLTLLEFTSLLWLRFKRENAERVREENQKKLQALEGVIGGKNVSLAPLEVTRTFTLEGRALGKYELFAETIEKYGFTVFFSLFLLFNVVYWSWLIAASGYSTWEVNKELNNVSV